MLMRGEYVPDNLGMVFDAGQGRQVGLVGDEGYAGRFGRLHVNFAVSDKERFPRLYPEVVQHL